MYITDTYDTFHTSTQYTSVAIFLGEIRLKEKGQD